MSPFSSSGNDPIARELDADERVLWSGQPDPARVMRRAIPTALFSIPMLAFAAFLLWTDSTSLRMALASGKTPSFGAIAVTAFGLIFVVGAIGAAISPWLERAKASCTFYALTNRRALVVIESVSRRVRSVLPAEFTLERRDFSDGQGDVILKRQTKGSGEDQKTIEIGFYGISNAREVERMARELAQGAR